MPKIERDNKVTSVTSVPSSDKIVGSRITDRQEYRAHEADIKVIFFSLLLFDDCIAICNTS